MGFSDSNPPDLGTPSGDWNSSLGRKELSSEHHSGPNDWFTTVGDEVVGAATEGVVNGGIFSQQPKITWKVKESSDMNLDFLPRQLIIEFPETLFVNVTEEARLQCMGWRVAVEANNVGPWKTLPEECFDYVKDYMLGRSYDIDLERVSKEARDYAKSIELEEDGMDAWIFDIDETLLSNLPYYSEHGFGLEMFDNAQFDKWVLKGAAPAINHSLKLYQEVLRLGFKIILLTGRNEDKRNVTVTNLKNAAFQKWDKLILRDDNDHGKSAIDFKSEKREELIEEGFRIHGNSGDQWSDLVGYSTSVRSFKLPNPMYHIP